MLPRQRLDTNWVVSLCIARLSQGVSVEKRQCFPYHVLTPTEPYLEVQLVIKGETCTVLQQRGGQCFPSHVLTPTEPYPKVQLVIKEETCTVLHQKGAQCFPYDVLPPTEPSSEVQLVINGDAVLKKVPSPFTTLSIWSNVARLSATQPEIPFGLETLPHQSSLPPHFYHTRPPH